MTMGGAMSATGVLFVVLLAFGAIGWSAVTTSPVGEVEWPSWIFLPMFGALGVAFLTIFKPHLARFTSFLYAALEGVVLGAISRIYDAQWNGIVIQAVLLTAAVFFGMLLLYSTRIIKVTDRMRRMVIVATFGVVVVYGVVADREPVRGEHLVHHGSEPLLDPVQRRDRRPGCLQPDARLRLHRARRQRGPSEADGVVRSVRPDGHPRVAVSRDPEAARQAAFPLIGSATVGRHG